jgi:oligoribonuclease NrnB/cAMP/cGMP phosphodiesterase (DHH superfamily)
MDYIIYHASCQDGWVAAYVAAKKWPNATLLPLSYGLSPAKLDEVFKDVFHKDVIMVDYSFPSRELMEELARVTKSLQVYDHHISKKDVLEGLPYAVFDNARSGAGLAWDYLFGKDSGFTDVLNRPFRPRPWWVNYTEDQDLWKFKLPESRIVNAYLMVQPRTIESWKKIELVSVREAMDFGSGANARAEFEVRALLNILQKGVFHDWSVGVVNTSVAVSEVGEAIYNSGYAIAMTWHERANGDVSFGLRSTTVDVGAIAKEYGGGGHKNSAGFELSIYEARKLLDKVLSRGTHAEPTSRCC